MFENRVLRGIFGFKRAGEIYDRRKLRNEKLYNMYSSSNIITLINLWRKRWAMHVALMEIRNAYRIMVGKPEGKRPFGRPKNRNGAIKLNLKLRKYDWVQLAQDMDR
jgi:hypothetical protein